MSEAIKEIFRSRIYGIIREDEPQKALEIVQAYLEGGIKVVEINFLSTFVILLLIRKYVS